MKKFIFLFLLFLSESSIAQQINVLAKTDRTTVPLNQTFTFTIVIQYEGNEPKDLNIPNLSKLTDFNVLHQWSGSQSSIRIVNGRMERSKILEKSYQLQPKSKGTLRLESLDVRVNGRIYKTKPIFVKVIKQKQGSPSFPQSNPLLPNSPFGFDPLFDSFFKDSPFSPAPTLSSKNIKFRTSLNKKSVYERESIKAEWILFSSSGSIRYEIDKRPKLQGFWKEELKNPYQGKFLGTTVLDGVLYRKTLLDSVYLFPLKSGNLNVDPYSVQVNFLAGFNTRSKIVRSNIKTIQVKPLPLDKKQVFSGAVGNFKVKAFIKKTRIKVNEPITYHIQFEGDGHPQFIKLPKISFPPSLKAYAPVEKSEFNFNKNFKYYEIILIPKIQGQIKIPSFQVSTFDPKQARYIYHQMPSFVIDVLKGNQAAGEGVHFFGDEENKQEKFELKFLKPMSWFTFFNYKEMKNFWLIFYSVLSLIFLSLLLWPLKIRKKSAKEKLIQGLLEVEELIEKKAWKRASIQLISLVYLVLYQFDTRSHSPDWVKLIKQLPPSLYKKYGNSLIDIMKRLDGLSFSQKKLSNQEAIKEVNLLYKQAEKLLIQLLD